MPATPRCIEPPPRAGALGTVLILLTIGAFSATPFIQGFARYGFLLLIGGIALWSSFALWSGIALRRGIGHWSGIALRHGISRWIGIALRRGIALRSGIALWSGRESLLPAFPVSFILSLTLAAFLIPGKFFPWPVPVLAAIGVYVAMAFILPWMRRSLGWIRLGRLGRRELLLIGGFSLLASSALVLWVTLVHPDLSDLVAQLPLWPPILLVLLGIAFASLNAFAEEVLFRGFIFEALDSALGYGLAPLVLQAVSFGMLHYHGFPRGWIGVGLATLYGLMMGIIRRSAGGMLAPWISHVFADLTIFGVLWWMA